MGAPQDLELLIQSRYPVIAVETREEDRLQTALEEVAAHLRLPFWLWTVTAGLQRAGNVNAVYDSQAPLKALANIAVMPGEGLYLLKDLQRFLDQAEVLRKVLDMLPAFKMDRRSLVLSAVRLELPDELRAVAATYTLALPTVDELGTLARRVAVSLARDEHVRVELTDDDYARIVDRMRGLTAFEAERALTRAALVDRVLNRDDVERLVDVKKELLQKDGLLDYVAPEENLADIGGFRALKAWLEKRKRGFGPDARSFGLETPKGVLLLGVNGCGKSLVARAVAREWRLPLLKLEPGRLYDKYIGETEKNLEKALATAERMAPCVLLIDEMEKTMTLGGADAGDAGLSRRVFGRMLSWLQDRTAAVFVVATCNDITALPPEMTRKGRFDELFFVDLPGHDERREIFAVHLARRKRDPKQFDLDALAAGSDGFSGAEIEQAVVGALYTAFSRGTDVTTAILLEELVNTKPISVTRREEVDALRAWAKDRTVAAN